MVQKEKLLIRFVYLFMAIFILGTSFGTGGMQVIWSSTLTPKESVAIIEKQQVLEKKEQEKMRLEEEQKRIARFKTLKEQLENYIEQQEGQIGISVIDVASEQSIEVNGQKKFYASSTIKVPMAMLIADKITQGKLSWQTQLDYDEEDYEDGTGILAGNLKASYDVETLVKYALVHSDNIAKNMLFSNLASTYNQGLRMVYEQYLPNEKIVKGNHFSSSDLSRILLKLEKEKSHHAGYQKIYTYLTQTVFHERLETPLTKGHIAHKIGSNDRQYHDIGIVDGKHRYILAVMTNEVPQAEKKISEMSDLVYRAMEQ